jgi:hypothetical protein
MCLVMGLLVLDGVVSAYPKMTSVGPFGTPRASVRIGVLDGGELDGLVWLLSQEDFVPDYGSSPDAAGLACGEHVRGLSRVRTRDAL